MYLRVGPTVRWFNNLETCASPPIAVLMPGRYCLQYMDNVKQHKASTRQHVQYLMFE